MKDKNTLATYIPTKKKQPCKRAPIHLKNSFVITAKKILNHSLTSDRAHRLDDRSELHRLANDYYNLVLEIGNFKDMNDILHQTLEYQLHWPNLKQQRQYLSSMFPTWRYHLESVSIFPLLYTIGWHNNTDPKSFSSMLDQCNIPHYSTIPLPLRSIKFFTDKAVASLRFDFHKTLQRTAEIVAEATNTKPTDFMVDPANDISLIIPSLFAVKAPTFETQWKNLGYDPTTPTSHITNQRTAKQPVHSTAVVACLGNINRCKSSPVDIPHGNQQPLTCEVTKLPALTYQLYSDAVKENISPPLDLETLMKETLGDDYVQPTVPATSTNPWDNYSPVSPDPSDCHDHNYIRDPLLYNAHSANYNNTDNF